MQLTTPAGNEQVNTSVTAPTVVEPEQDVIVRLHISAFQNIELLALDFDIPEVLIKNEEEPSTSFPLSLQPEDTFEKDVIFKTHAGQEGFGLIKGKLVYNIQEIENSIEFELWISVFKRVKAGDREALSTELRKRLVDVVNIRDRNGHIFVADYVAFFNDFLNIEVPETVQEILAEDFQLPIEGLPVDEETRLQIILGNKTFYGIEKLELIPEEECVESDDRFDPYDAREVKFEEDND